MTGAHFSTPREGSELRVPLTRLDNADPDLMAELLEVAGRVARSAAFTLGTEVEAFEEEFADYCGARYAVGVSSGTSALALALWAAGIGPGDEVIVPANSFIATAEAVSLIGATPKLVDVERDSALVSVEIIEAAIGPRTRCIIPVHLYGAAVDLMPILALAAARGLVVIEDACQAHGARLADRRVGSLGDAGCFSFYPAKNLGAWGDGGAVVTDNRELADRVRRLRSHGETQRYQHDVIGTTARLDAIQAAILRVKLRRLDAHNAARRRVAGELAAGLSGAPLSWVPLSGVPLSGVPLSAAPLGRGIAIGAPLALAGDDPSGGDHVFHQFVVASDDRDGLRRHLAECGVDTAIHYPVPIHRTPAYARYGDLSLPVVEELAGEICSLPMFPGMTDAEIARVIAAVMSFDAPASATSARR